MNFYSFFIVGFILLISSSCSVVRQTAASTSGNLFYQASFVAQEEQDYGFFKESTAASIKMAEGLLSLSPNDDDLLVLAIKAHAGYAFGVFETELLTSTYKNRIDNKVLGRARYHYKRSLELGLEWFSQNGIGYNDLIMASRDPLKMAALFDEKIGKSLRDFEAVMFTAQSLGGLINLDRNNMMLISQLPVVSGMFDWVCSKRPNINEGACDIYSATMDSSRPKMLGGNPKKGKELFLKAQSKYPKNKFISVMYLQNYVIPQLDEKEYFRVTNYLRKDFDKLKKELSWTPVDPYMKKSPVALFNAIAMRRFEIIEQNRKVIFE